MLLDQIALGSKQPYSAAEHVKITLNTNDLSPCTISNADPALNTLALGCPDYGAILARRMSHHVVAVGQSFVHTVGGRELQFHIESINEIENSDPFIIKPGQTKITIIETGVNDLPVPCGGVDQLVEVLSNVIDGAASKMRSAFQALSMPITKSILLHGVTGVGKATVVRHVARQLRYTLYTYHIRDLIAMSDQFDDPSFATCNNLRMMFERARANSKSILLIQGLDILQIDSNVDSSIRKKIIATLRETICSIRPDEQVFVIALARSLKRLPETLKSLDIFDQHEHISIPTRQQRQLILDALIDYYNLQLKPNYSREDTLSLLSQRTSGYVARDLKLLLRSAMLHAMRSKQIDDVASALDSLTLSEEQSNCTPFLSWINLEYALENSLPSQQAGFETTMDKKSWDDIGGYKDLKIKLQRAVLLPISNPETYAKLGISPPSGLLLYGPSGCGKSLLVQALASESTMNVINVKGPEVFSKYLGETEAVIRNLFATAKRISPCIVFIDEMDSIACKRGWDSGEGGNSVNERVLSTLLNEMDGVEGRTGVFVIGCTNRPDQIDDAILRPGRLDLLLHVDLPNQPDRREIIQNIMSQMAIAPEVEAEAIANSTAYCTGADIHSILREAAKHAIREDVNIPHISQRHIDIAVANIQRKAQKYALDGSNEVFNKFSNRDTK
ncbi:hypothetical protein INT43_002385 [Umbelopsis isabellina]|uniref:AAA+ ATPase domain-containing protein n=1 Tax=Mortierella isabellina TaxID=91625 RepID=A0A8H7ULA6_MORIS|nr:hypothetical protein INT43_002385 [Umbelopsis isabellina]